MSDAYTFHRMIPVSCLSESKTSPCMCPFAGRACTHSCLSWSPWFGVRRHRRCSERHRKKNGSPLAHSHVLSAFDVTPTVENCFTLAFRSGDGVSELSIMCRSAADRDRWLDTINV